MTKAPGKSNPLSQEGFKYSLATGTHGGVQVLGDIRQEAIINLVALRTLSTDPNLKRYLLGLALVALSYRDQMCFNLREGCLLRAASKDDYDGTWKSVNFDGTDGPAMISHDIALAYAQAAAQNITIDVPEADRFDKDTAEAWLEIDKKERKGLAKTMHPSEAIARKRKKQAEEDAKSPVDAVLKALKAIKLGARPKEGKPPKILTDKFDALRSIFENLVNDATTDESLKSLASDLVQLIQQDKDSHALHDELTKRLEEFKKMQRAGAAEESTVATEGEAGQ